MKRGHFIRLLLSTVPYSSDFIAAAKTLSFHGSSTIEESSTKDTADGSLDYDVMSKAYDISGSGLVLTDNSSPAGYNLNSFIEQFGDNLYWKICVVNGSNQRTIVSTIASGQCIITGLTAQGQNGAKATYNYTLKGYGPITPSIEGIEIIRAGTSATFPASTPSLSGSTIDFNTSMTVRALLKYLHLFHELDGENVEAELRLVTTGNEAGCINVFCEGDNILTLRPNEDGSSWTIIASEGGPTWTSVSLS